MLTGSNQASCEQEKIIFVCFDNELLGLQKIVKNYLHILKKLFSLKLNKNKIITFISIILL